MFNQSLIAYHLVQGPTSKLADLVSALIF